jgi:hypothetical protein
LARDGAAGRQHIDLHWALSHVRGPLPTFQEAWQFHKLLDVNGQRVFTLSRIHAFQHACAHAAIDQWGCLRNLIDIDRLWRQLRVGEADLSILRQEPTVRWSSAVTHAATAAEDLRVLFQRDQSGSTYAVERSKQIQLLPWRSQGNEPWSPQRWAANIWRLLVLSHHSQDWLRIILFVTFPPAVFSDPHTGEDRGFLGFLSARLLRLRRRMGERKPSNRLSSAQHQPKPEKSMQRIKPNSKAG